jgi:hypothetical protein
MSRTYERKSYRHGNSLRKEYILADKKLSTRPCTLDCCGNKFGKHVNKRKKISRRYMRRVLDQAIIQEVKAIITEINFLDKGE